MKSFQSQRTLPRVRNILPTLKLNASRKDLPYISPEVGTRNESRSGRNTDNKDIFKEAISKYSYAGAESFSPSKMASIFSLIQDIKKEEQETAVLRIQFVSNYGNVSSISCSEIDILDRKNCRLEILNTFITPLNVNCDLPYLLTNGELVKQPNEVWTCDWNGKAVCVNILASITEVPSFVRIWNGGLDPSTHVKEVRIFLNENFVGSSTVPQSMGATIPISNLTDSPTRDLKCIPDFLLEKNVQNIPEDRYGIVPINAVKTISIEIVDGYSPTGIVGLNAIDIITWNGKNIKKSEIAKLWSTNCQPITTLGKLIKKNKDVDSYGDMWIAKRESMKLSACVNIELTKPTRVALIIIYNYMCIDPNEQYPAKRIQVRADGVIIGRCFVKVLHEGSTIVNKSNKVWLTDVPQIRRAIKHMI